MEQNKEQEIDKIRLIKLRKDLTYLRNKDCNIINISEELYKIEIEGLLFDLRKLNALYVRGCTSKLILQY